MVGAGVVRGAAGDVPGDADAEADGDDAGVEGAGVGGPAVHAARAATDKAAIRGRVLWVLSRRRWNGDIIMMLPLRYRLETPVRLPARPGSGTSQRHPGQ